MTDLSTTYMGLPLSNPVVVAACSLSNKVDEVKRIEAAGAGALVIKSLFEEQILHETAKLDEALNTGAEAFAESVSYFPHVEHSGAKEHLFWVNKIRQEVKMPLIGSLNAVHPGTWVDYARQMADTGVDGLELNVYAVEADVNRTAADVESQLLDTFEAVVATTKLPVAVKLSPFHSSTGNVVRELQKRGAKAVVLFNRFLQPTIDLEKEALRQNMTLSSNAEMRLPLRWIALLYGKVGLDLAANTGAMDGQDVARYLLAGATIVQVASTLYKNGVEHLTTLRSDIEKWMTKKDYSTLDAFRGKVSQKNFKGSPVDFERAQYLDLLFSMQK